MSKAKNGKRLLIFSLILILLLGLIFSGLRILESTVLSKGQDLQEPAGKSLTITRSGVDYFPRQDITVLLFMGIDDYGPVKSSGLHVNTGRADAIMLIIIDQKDESYTVLGLNRDTMVKMPVLGIGGKVAGSYYGQIALSHSYGEGLEDSCENTKKTVSDFLYGIMIDHYVALNMEGIAIINDAVGGVEVNVEEDFSNVDSSIKMGKMVLNGDQALSYVHERMKIDDQLNISRMGRHEKYMNGLMAALDVKMEENDSFVIELYDQVSDYVVTDCSINTISGLVQRCSDYELKGFETPEGDNIRGEEYYEFYVDEENLDELILKLFYAPK